MNRSNEPITQAFGQKIRIIRKSFGWSQEALAHRAGLNRSYLGQIERGETLVSIVTIEKLAKAFRLSLSLLLAELPTPAPSTRTESTEQSTTVPNTPAYSIRYLSAAEPNTK
ncbi:MAG TPA: helix-turn-helix transcriptional regulator [Cellvibrionaceae bacterium]|nr:helix-turn-helix transcriptional regulator [Cellvibrionaceae bacterium]HMW73144.1 helix-turn-helix transcriptional regulator [Cellvibrionaceae bacterium]HMY39799.1 helix-turn-helix transcriptional regulator [Marinagarivorans sp.]HNG60518.1 helix-turn-helix transcriptional regulator [Cellvibrionaceae bacterium]